MKEKIITTLSTTLTVKEVMDRLQLITVDKYVNDNGTDRIRYIGIIRSDMARLRSINVHSKSLTPTYWIKYYSSDNRTMIIVTNDLASRVNDSIGYMLIMAFPIGLILLLGGIYNLFKVGISTFSVLFSISGAFLLILPFVKKPKIAKGNFQMENDREIEWLNKYLEAEKHQNA